MGIPDNVMSRRGVLGLKAAAVAAALTLAVSFTGVVDAQAVAATPGAGEVVTLAQFVDQALAAGPDILLSNATLGIAQAAYAEAQSQNGFGLSGNLSANQQSPLVDTIRLLPGTTPLIGSGSATAGVTLTGPLGLNVGASATHSITEDSSLAQATTMSASAGANLWDGYPGGAGLASVRRAALANQATQLSEDNNRKTIVYNVKQAYYSLLAQQRQIRILQSTLAQRQEEMKKSQALFDAQSANQIDLKTAQVNLRQAELDLLQAQDSLEVSRQKLSALVGWPLDKSYSAAEVEDLPVPDMQVADAVKAALAQRSDMKQLQTSQSDAQIALDVKRGQAGATVKATAGLDWTHDWNDQTDSLVARAGVTVSAPIIDGGSAAAQVKQAELNVQTYRIKQDQLAAQIATNVRNALSTLRDLVARVDLAQANLDLAQNQYDLTKTQFDSGVKANLDVLAASVTLTTAQVNLAKARADAQLGVLALQNSLGN